MSQPQTQEQPGTALVLSTEMTRAVQQVHQARERAVPQAEIDRLSMAIRQLSKTGIQNDLEYKRAGGILFAQRQWYRRWEQYWKPWNDLFYRPYSMVRDYFNPGEKALKELGRQCEAAMGSYIERKRREKEEQEAALRRAAEEAQRQAEQQAARLMEQGNVKAAKAVAAQASTIVAPVLPDPTPAIDGVKTRGSWKIEIADKLELIKAVATGQAPLTVLDVNEGVLRKLAIAQEGLSYPGVKATWKLGFGVSCK